MACTLENTCTRGGVACTCRVALDGVVEAGGSAVDEAVITGEARPVAKGPGDAVLGGSTNVGHGPLKVRVCV